MQWVPLLGEPPPTHLLNHEINYNQPVPSYIISNKWYQYHAYSLIFQPVQWVPLLRRRVPSNPPLWDLTTLYLFLVLVVFILCRYNIIGSPSKSSLTSPPCLPHGSPKNRERLLQAHACKRKKVVMVLRYLKWFLPQKIVHDSFFSLTRTNFTNNDE